MNEPGELMASARDGALVVRSPGWLLLTGGLRLFGGMAVMVVAVAPGLGGGTPARVALGLASAAVLVIATRTFLGGVYIRADGVLVRNPFRSWRLRWDEIEGVAPRPVGPLAALMLRGGKQIPVCSWGWPSPARREQLASLLWTARPERVTAR
jgi:hypothetical protein